jgi:hypothetical protein
MEDPTIEAIDNEYTDDMKRQEIDEELEDVRQFWEDSDT